MKSLLHGFRLYAHFSGNTPRRTFWEFVSITQVVFIILLLPAWFVFLEFFNEAISDPRVLDIIFAMAQTREILFRELAEVLLEIWQTFSVDLIDAHKEALICTGVALLWGAVTALPTLAITARRLHDAGHSRWWICPIILLCIPLPIIADIGFIGSIVTLIFCAQPSRGEAPLPPIPPNGHAAN